MLMERRGVAFLFLLTFSCFPTTFGSEATDLHPDEMDALQQIGKKLGKNWNYSANPCTGESGWLSSPIPPVVENNVTCSCSQNDTFCHVERIVLKGQDLQGKLPPELAKLPFLKEIDLTRNYLSSTIPAEWGSMQLEIISLLGNRITGPIPKELWNISNLTELILEANMFFGDLEGIEKLVSIKRILLSSNAFSGQLPTSLANLTNLTDFRISDNNFTGRIPDFITNWIKLEKLVIQGSGLQGPIPSGISSLVKLTDLRISDINGTASPFPKLENMIGIKTLILRNCNLTGAILPYIWTKMTSLKTLDLSFNMLEGHLPPIPSKPEKAVFIYLTSNLLNGSVPVGLKKVSYVDLSYNNFTRESTEDCQDGKLNLFGSPPTANNLSGAVPPCLKDFDCPKSLKLHFAEIMFSDDKSYRSLGKRIFDIYIQRKLVWKDFDIVAEAGGTHKAVVRNFTANVTTNTLEIRFYWAGKGTQSLPNRGVYGPLISAISVESGTSCGDKRISAGAVIGIVASVFCVIFLIIGILWWKGCFRKKNSMYEDLKRLDLHTGSFTLRQLKAATNNFDAANKIGEGGFGPVYKAYVLQERGSLIELVDPKLGSEFNKEEAIGVITIALLCTNSSSTLRPTMSAVVSMLEGRTDVQSHISVPNLSSDDLDTKAIRSHRQQIHSQEQNLSQSQSISIDGPQTASSASASDLYPIIMDSEYWNNRE
ncbi:hypothetical protein MRB53_035940 [Persea americana]|uniref:Uncharacterized protein n=1 Tax=Persea americana TaxID=3435 RepID=A0ACC2K612_PERAE|nr:hypothetical protein MRB53_035940 [Persea americana]